MSERIFIGTRVSNKKNLLFPDRIIINSENVLYEKGQIFGRERVLIKKANISSVSVKQGMFFAELVIESNGGQRIVASGFLISQAKEIMNLLI